MSNAEERVNAMLEAAEIGAATFFDRCMVTAAKLEDGQIVMAAYRSDSEAEFDHETATEACMYQLFNALMEREAPPAFELTEKEAQVIIALSHEDLTATRAAQRLNLRKATVSGHISKIRDKTGLDPMRFYDMCQLLVVAREVVREDEAE